jgi:hypothetical protein
MIQHEFWAAMNVTCVTGKEKIKVSVPTVEVRETRLYHGKNDTIIDYSPTETILS